MSIELSKSNQQLLTLILILLSIPVLYELYEIFVVEGRISLAKFESTPFWLFLRLSVNVIIIVLLALRKLSVLLFIIVVAGSECIRMLFSLRYFDDLDLKFWILQLINLAGLILMIILLKRENNRFFNLEFSAKNNGFEKTARLIRIFNLTFLFTQIIELCITIGIALYYMSFEVSAFLNNTFALFLITMALTILGLVRKTKISNLAFLLILSLLLNIFISSSYVMLAPFTKTWNEYNNFEIIYGLIIDVFLLTFGILMFYITKAYFKEKAELNNQSGSVSNLPNSELLDAL